MHSLETVHLHLMINIVHLVIAGDVRVVTIDQYQMHWVSSIYRRGTSVSKKKKKLFIRSPLFYLYAFRWFLLSRITQSALLCSNYSMLCVYYIYMLILGFSGYFYSCFSFIATGYIEQLC